MVDKCLKQFSVSVARVQAPLLWACEVHIRLIPSNNQATPDLTVRKEPRMCLIIMVACSVKWHEQEHEHTDVVQLLAARAHTCCRNPGTRPAVVA